MARCYGRRMPPPPDNLYISAGQGGTVAQKKEIPLIQPCSEKKRQTGQRSRLTMVVPRGPAKGSQGKTPPEQPKGGPESSWSQWWGKWTGQGTPIQSVPRRSSKSESGGQQPPPIYPDVEHEVLVTKGSTTGKRLFKEPNKGGQQTNTSTNTNTSNHGGQHAQAQTQAQHNQAHVHAQDLAQSNNVPAEARALTQEEIEEYNKRLQAYYAEQHRKMCAEMESGHFQIHPGDLIDRSTPGFSKGRYKVIQLLGSGTYGKVVLCEDSKYNQAHVAVKLVRRHPPTYKMAAKQEIRILQQLNGYGNCVKLLRTFNHDGHVSMTFELLGESIFSLVQRQRFSLQRVRDVTVQILQAVDYVHANHIIHSDIKSENVLIASHPDAPGPLYVKLVDFGCAVYSTAWHPPVAGTMNYRSPEAVLQAEWSYAVDSWGIGCIFVEMLIGRQMFELAHDDVHLNMMQRVFGPIPSHVLLRGWSSSSPRGLLAMGPNGQVQVAPCRIEGRVQLETVKPLRELITHPQAYDLARHFFEYDPSKRITPGAALQHQFFHMQLTEDLPPQHAHTHLANGHVAGAQLHADCGNVCTSQHTSTLRLRILIILCLLVVLIATFGGGFLHTALFPLPAPPAYTHPQHPANVMVESRVRGEHERGEAAAEHRRAQEHYRSEQAVQEEAVLRWQRMKMQHKHKEDMHEREVVRDEQQQDHGQEWVEGQQGQRQKLEAEGNGQDGSVAQTEASL